MSAIKKCFRFYLSKFSRESTISQLTALFRSMDLNKDGVITKDEFETYMAQYEQDFSTKFPLIRSLFDELDINQDDEV